MMSVSLPPGVFQRTEECQHVDQTLIRRLCIPTSSPRISEIRDFKVKDELVYFFYGF